MISLQIIPVTPCGDGFASLKAQSLRENFNMLRRLEENWCNGSNCFSAPGEKLLGVAVGGALVGIGGLNRDPFAHHPRAGRIRHLYLSPSWRGKGVGQRLLQAIIEGSEVWFDFYNTYAPRHAFRFYEAAGFQAVANEEKVTYRLVIHR